MDQVRDNVTMKLFSLTMLLFSGRQTWPQSISRAWNHPGGPPEEDKHFNSGHQSSAKCEC